MRCWAQGLPHAKRMWYHYTMCPWVTALIVSDIAKTCCWFSGWLAQPGRKQGTHPSNGHTSPTLRKRGRDDLEHFFEQKHLSRIGVEKPPKSSRPAFSRVYCPPGPCADSGTDRQDTRPTNSTAETLSVEGAGGRKKSFSSQLTCSMLCMDTLGMEPRAFRMRSGCDITTPCAPESLLS